MKALHGAFYCLIALTGVGCDLLNVTNNNNPNREAALGTPTDLENFVGFLYAVAHSGTLGGAAIPGCTEPCIDGLQAQMQTMGMENVSGLANFAMGPRSAIPRNPIDNTPGSQGNVGDYRDFTVEHRAARMASLAIAKINQFGTLGSDARTARARAFALIDGDPELAAHPRLRRELEDFLNAIREKRPPLVSGEDAVETLRVAIAANESHRTGKLVQLT